MVDADLGANEFTFSGDRTQITYLTQTPGPLHPGQEGGRLTYQGIEGEHTFTGKEIDLERTPLGALLTVTLSIIGDSGGLTVTVLIPQILDITRENPVTFTTIAIKATSRGNFISPGAALTYTIIPLMATASIVMIPLAREGAAG
ncbi:MAG: hypothetical protein QOE72_3335 [Chloroflexota bacterium]|jgi:hypothetical protein|nr:hypothetical protein [Chloroflexota bacterium]